MTSLLPVPIEHFEQFLVCLGRTAALVMSIPVFNGEQVPAQVKTGLTLFIALLLFPVVSRHIHIPPFHPGNLLVLLATEVLLGAAIGLIARLIFTAIELGGTIIGFQMGFAAANVFDPQNQQQTSVMAQFQSIFAVLLFLSLNVHHSFIQAFAASFEMIPPGTLDFTGPIATTLTELTSRMFTVAIQLSAPVLAVLLLSGLVLGLMSRVFPQLQVFLLSFPVNIAVSLLVIGFTLNLAAILLTREFDMLPERIGTFFTLVG